MCETLRMSTTRHDARVAEALSGALVRLVSASWLRSQADGFVLSRMQDLPPEALVPCEEAKALFQSNDRRVGALSYGWLTPLHSDPHGLNTAHVLTFLRSEAGSHVEALFWDYA